MQRKIAIGVSVSLVVVVVVLLWLARGSEESSTPATSPLAAA